MTIGVVFFCRGSRQNASRDILKEVRGSPLISHVLARIKLAAPERPLVVVTSKETDDDPVAAYCRRCDIDVVRDSEEDVDKVFLSCLERFGWEFGVKVDQAGSFFEVSALHAMLAIADTEAFDLVTNVFKEEALEGLGITILRADYLSSQISHCSQFQGEMDVTSRIHDELTVGRKYFYKNAACLEPDKLDLAINTPEEFQSVPHCFWLAGLFPGILNFRHLYGAAAQYPEDRFWKGPDGPLLVAEIGGNHEGCFEAAQLMCEKAIASGVGCVKFQIYRGSTLVSRVESPERHEHFQRFELSQEQHIQLAEMCRAAGVIYSASVWEKEMLDWIDPYLDFYKIGSGDLTAWPLLREFARRGKPILLSTGLATMDEVLQTVAFIQRVDERYKQPEMLCLMQCTSMYPIPDHEANLRVMDAYRARTGLAVGYSDHTTGTAALRAAAAMGAQALEFHFTDSRDGKSFRDHKVSLVAEEVRQLKEEIRQITELRGYEVKAPTKSELDNQHDTSFRRGVYLRRSMAVGEVIKAADLILLRPAVGTDARDADALDGAIVLKDIEAMSAIYPGIDYEIPEER